MARYSGLRQHWFQRTIVVVGGGFSGTAVVLNLLQRPAAMPTRVLLIEKGSYIGQGPAFAARDFPYLLNVPAGGMSVFPRDPNDFLRFARLHDPSATAGDFLPRALYGRYLAARLRAAEQRPAANLSLETVQGVVVAANPIGGGTAYEVRLADGRRFAADELVIATGHGEPAPLPGSANLGRHHGLHNNPWKVQTPALRGRRVLLVGTGLTMADVALAAASDESRPALIHAVSSHGLLPQVHGPQHLEALNADVGTLLFRARSLRQLLHATRFLASEIAVQGGDWRDVIALVRQAAPTLWSRLPVAERRRFLRHLDAYWNIHRHRLPAAVITRLGELRQQGRLHIHAGRVRNIRATKAGLRVTWQPRGETGVVEHSFDSVVNCTGPDYDVRRATNPLIRSLLEQGLAVPDATQTGLEVDSSYQLTGFDGLPVSRLYYLGPLLRGEFLEATAVAELRAHAARLAQGLLPGQPARFPAVRHTRQAASIGV